MSASERIEDEALLSLSGRPKLETPTDAPSVVSGALIELAAPKFAQHSQEIQETSKVIVHPSANASNSLTIAQEQKLTGAKKAAVSNIPIVKGPNGDLVPVTAIPTHKLTDEMISGFAERSKLFQRRSRTKSQTKIVLDEEEYVDTLQRIIARDYMPEAYDYLYGSRKPVSNSTMANQSTRGTTKRMKLEPTGTKGGQRRASSRGVDDEWDDTSSEDDTDEQKVIEPTPSSTHVPRDQLSLEAFTQLYTSEDNDSAEKLMDKETDQKRRQYWWIQQQIERTQRIIDKSQAEHHKTNPNSSISVASISYDPTNALMFTPSHEHKSSAGNSGVPPAESSHVVLVTAQSVKCNQPSSVANATATAEALKRPAPKIIAANTRFPKQAALDQVAAQLRMAETSQQPNTRSGQEWELLKTPLIVAGETRSTADSATVMSPIVTWGKIASTPINLWNEDSETAEIQALTQTLRSTTGDLVPTTRGYKMPEPAKRETALFEQHRQKQLQQLQANRMRRAHTPVNVSGRSTIPGTAALRAMTPVDAIRALKASASIAATTVGSRRASTTTTTPSVRANVAATPRIHK